MTTKAAKIRAPTLAEMADELGAIQKEYDLALAPLEMKLPRLKALKEALQEACPANPDKDWIVEGARFGVRLGPCANQRSVNIAALVKKIGAAAFAKFASCTIAALDCSVDVQIAKSVITSAQNGPRKLSTFEKGIHLVVAPTK